MTFSRTENHVSLGNCARLTALFFVEWLSRRPGFTTCPARRSRRGHPQNWLHCFDHESAPRRPRGWGEGETRGGRPSGWFPVGRAARRRDRPGESGV